MTWLSVIATIFALGLLFALVFWAVLLIIMFLENRGGSDG